MFFNPGTNTCLLSTAKSWFIRARPTCRITTSIACEIDSGGTIVAQSLSCYDGRAAQQSQQSSHKVKESWHENFCCFFYKPKFRRPKGTNSGQCRKHRKLRAIRRYTQSATPCSLQMPTKFETDDDRERNCKVHVTRTP